ncbi:MAG: two-component system, OmpR family, response regulator MprA [Gaiellaceae bacterium]|nr:two-component system, OmpR family, response regulator MprA [Gaiellaceae bacterium]
MVLVVDDDRAVREALARALALEGYDVEVAPDGTAALTLLARDQAEAVILDVQMPGIDGLEVCRRLRRAENRVPSLMLTVRAAVDERVEGLDAGADDYLTKPFALEELLARLRALLRRRPSESPAEQLSFADLTLDLGTLEAVRGRNAARLSLTEANLLEVLLRNPRQVLTRRLIYERVWGYDFSLNSTALEVYIGYLRRKTEANGEPRLIQTVRGVGYSLRDA